MTKIKNTKKGMAKKTLSMSLVVAMLATSNVPVWAAEFSDGTESTFTTEAETPVVEDNTNDAVDTQATAADTFTDDTDTAPVVDDTEAVDAQAVETSSDDYAFTNVKAKKEAVDTDWKTAFKINGASADELFDKDSAIVDSRNGNETQTNNLYYVFRIGGEWDEAIAEKQEITWKANTNAKLINSNISLSDADLRAAAGKTLELLFLERDDNGKLNVVNTISYGTLQKVDLQSVLTVTAVDNITYDGTDKKAAAIPGVSGTLGTKTFSKDDFDWDYKSTASDYVNAGSVITATGKLKDTVKESIKNELLGYNDTVSANCTIGKRALSASDVIVKLATPKKNFEYQNNANTEVDKSEVKVYLKDYSKIKDGNYASAISLDEYVKKVTLDTTKLGAKALSVTFDADALKASNNFTEQGDTTGITSTTTVNVETNTKEENTKVNVTALDLASCEITLKNPAQADKALKGNDLVLVIKKNGKTLELGKTITVTLKAGEDYSKVGTFSNAVTVAGNGVEVTGTKILDLVTIDQVFTASCNFRNNTNDKYLSKTKAGVSAVEGLDYNNGNAVEFAKDVLGKFSPDGTTYGDQSNFKITYDNNINATTEISVAKLTVTAIAGDYKGCSQDFYFKINPSKVVLSNSKTTNTVTTAVKKEVSGVSLNESYTSADQYADAIGLAFTGTNGETGDKKITSTPSTNDYKVEYSFVKAKDHTKAGENEVGDQVKVVVTLKENGNFKADKTNAVIFDNGIAGKVTEDAKTNGVITLYVPIVKKSIDSLDVSLKEDAFTFTGEMINPEVVVKENGKTLKDVVTIESITDGVNAGTATIKVSVKDYSGTKELKATINPTKLSDVVFEIKEGSKKGFTYNGKQQKPLIAQEDDPTTTKDETIAEAAATADVKLGKVIISKMFDITYGENINAGEKAGSVTLTPKALYAKNFDGTSLTANFDILRAVLSGSAISEVLSIKDATGKKVTIEKVPVEWDDNGNVTKYADYYGRVADSDSLTWTGNEAKFASVTVDDKKLGVAPTGTKFNDDDYAVVYVNNTDATSGSSKAYVAVIGKGNFKGEYSIVKIEGSRNYYDVMKTTDAEKEVKENPGRYTIVQSDVIANAVAEYDIVGSEFGAKNVTYSNGTYAGGLVVKPVVTVKDAKTDATLTEGTDYKVVVYDDTAINASSKKYNFAVVGLGKYRNSYVGMKDGKDLTYSIDKKDLKDCYVNVDKKDDKLDLTVMNGSVVEKTETFDVKDNGDGTATVSVVDGGKNYTGSVNVKVNDADTKVGTPLITDVVVKGNTVTPVLSSEVDAAVGYDYVIATEEDYVNGRVDISKNVLSTHTNFNYVQAGTYYAYCHAWKRGADEKKVFGEWSNLYKFEVKATTPSTPTVTSVKVKGSTVTVTYTASEDATGYDVVLGTSVKKVNGERRPVEYGKLVKKNVEEGTVEVTFTNVPSGTYYAGLHAYNRTSANASKVFSKWSNHKTVRVK